MFSNSGYDYPALKRIAWEAGFKDLMVGQSFLHWCVDDADIEQSIRELRNNAPELFGPRRYDE